MAAAILAPGIQNVKRLTWRRDEEHTCPDCGSALIWPAHRPGGTTTCYCPNCKGWARITANLELLVSWTPAGSAAGG